MTFIYKYLIFHVVNGSKCMRIRISKAIDRQISEWHRKQLFVIFPNACVFNERVIEDGTDRQSQT